MLAGRVATLLRVVALASAAVVAEERAGAGGVVAVNVLLLPARDMSAYARRMNSLLREGCPQGFALDATHVPHISILHRFVASQNLPKVYAAVERVLGTHAVAGQELTAEGFEHSTWEGRQITSIRVEKTSELTTLQRDLVAALRPYSVDSGAAGAFVTTPDAPQIGAATIEYVGRFVELRTGEGFKPHITLGFSDAQLASRLGAMSAAPKKFKVAAVAIYQIGDAGTARKELWRHERR